MAAAIGALAYPLVVWFGIGRIPAGGFVLAGIGLTAVRLVGGKGLTRSPAELAAILLAAALPLALLAVSADVAARIYPVAVSLGMAALFALSLRHPPTIVERIARLTEPDLPPAGVVYTTKVTRVWVGFLLCNATISLWTVLFGSLAQWTLWNGLLSYMAMGTLFAGEYAVRRVVRG